MRTHDRTILFLVHRKVFSDIWLGLYLDFCHNDYIINEKNARREAEYFCTINNKRCMKRNMNMRLDIFINIRTRHEIVPIHGIPGSKLANDINYFKVA